MRRVLNEDMVMNGEHRTVWWEPPSSEGFQRSILIRKGVNFGSTKSYPDQESTDTRIRTVGQMYRMARNKMILKRMVIFCHGDWCLSIKVHSYQSHNTFEILFATFLPFLPTFYHAEWCQIIGKPMKDICWPGNSEQTAKIIKIADFSGWPMRWSSFRASILKRVLGGKSNKFTWSTSISDSQESPPRPFFIILPETGQRDLSRRLHLSSLLIINMFFFSINIFYIKQKNTQNRRHFVQKMAEKLCLPTKKRYLWSKMDYFLSKKDDFVSKIALFGGFMNFSFWRMMIGQIKVKILKS